MSVFAFREALGGLAYLFGLHARLTLLVCVLLVGSAAASAAYGKLARTLARRQQDALAEASSVAEQVASLALDPSPSSQAHATRRGMKSKHDPKHYAFQPRVQRNDNTE
jgi:ABC-type multidrug transport system fused ATPase/permease subunit